MFKNHNHLCREFGQKNSKNMEAVIAFVFSSIRVQTSLLPRMAREYRRRGLASSWLWGNKRSGMEYIRKNRKLLYGRMMKILRSKKRTAQHDLIMLFLEVPGLGIPKAGFTVQLLTGKAGCMDVHNLRRYLPEIDAEKGTPAMFQTAGNSLELKSKKVKKYIEACKNAGGSRKMWDSWCCLIAEKQPKHFRDGFAVSRMHIECFQYPIVSGCDSTNRHLAKSKVPVCTNGGEDLEQQLLQVLAAYSPS